MTSCSVVVLQSGGQITLVLCSLMNLLCDLYLETSVIPLSLLHHGQLVSLSSPLHPFVLCFSASASFPSIHSIDSLPHRQGLLGREGVKCCRETFGFHCVVQSEDEHAAPAVILFYCTS